MNLRGACYIRAKVILSQAPVLRPAVKPMGEELICSSFTLSTLVPVSGYDEALDNRGVSRPRTYGAECQRQHGR